MRKVGILGAMPQEVEGIIALIHQPKTVEIGQRVYVSGQINHTNVVVVFSRWGKVAAATTVTSLIQHFNVTEVVFTGVAGGIDPKLKIGDFVIGAQFYQHDMDARPLMKQFEIPLLGTTFFSSNEDLIAKATNAAKLASSHFNTPIPNVHIGNIASGDQFIASEAQLHFIKTHLPSVVAVEMEGAAVAQVCTEFGMPFVVIRVISDAGNQEAPANFELFIENEAKKRSALFIQNFV